MKPRPLVLALMAILSCAHGQEGEEERPAKQSGNNPLGRPVPRLASAPVDSRVDGADDPAIWVHPTDPSKSLVFGTDKRDGLHVFHLDGTRREILSRGSSPNNVDVRYGVAVEGGTADIVAGSVRGRRPGLMAWLIDPPTGRVREASGFPVAVLNGDTPYGATLYRSARSGEVYAFVTSKSGMIEQLALTERGRLRLPVKPVRRWSVGHVAEGCVADDEYGHFYVAVENQGIFRYGAEPSDPTCEDDRSVVASLSGKGAIEPDVEGLALYCTSRGTGYLIASIQGADRFHVYERTGTNRLVKIIDPRPGGGFGDVQNTDGIDVCNRALPPRFEKGLFVAQDGSALLGRQDFKFFGFEDLAEEDLEIDLSFDPRKTVWRRL
jgi:3-phytase